MEYPIDILMILDEKQKSLDQLFLTTFCFLDMLELRTTLLRLTNDVLVHR